MKGFAAAPATLKEGEEAASITIQVAPDADLSREERILFRATGSHQGYPVVAESAVEIGLSP